MINEIQPWIGHEPSQKIHAEYLTQKSESAQGVFFNNDCLWEDQNLVTYLSEHKTPLDKI